MTRRTRPLPRARTSGLVVRKLEGELLIYDLQADRAISLNDTARIVFEACDGVTTFEDLRRTLQLDHAVIQLALRRLSRQNLLSEPYEDGGSRRDLLRKAALTAAALPLVSVLVVPLAAQGQSCVAQGASCVPAAANCCNALPCQLVAGVLGPFCCALSGQPCQISAPQGCCVGCCTSVGAPPGQFICCTF